MPERSPQAQSETIYTSKTGDPYHPRHDTVTIENIAKGESKIFHTGPYEGVTIERLPSKGGGTDLLRITTKDGVEIVPSTEVRVKIK